MKTNNKKYQILEGLWTEYLSFTPESGLFRWIKKPPYSRVAKGDIAGTPNLAGYTVIKLHGIQFYAHKLAWYSVYGYWPKNELDHINCNPSDNRILNLREATRLENARNRKGKKLKGAFTHHTFNGRWVSQIAVNHKQIYLGRFSTPEEAHAAYKKAAVKYHGKFARAF